MRPAATQCNLYACENYHCNPSICSLSNESIESWILRSPNRLARPDVHGRTKGEGPRAKPAAGGSQNCDAFSNACLWLNHRILCQDSDSKRAEDHGPAAEGETRFRVDVAGETTGDCEQGRQSCPGRKAELFARSFVGCVCRQKGRPICGPSETLLLQGPRTRVEGRSEGWPRLAQEPARKRQVTDTWTDRYPIPIAQYWLQSGLRQPHRSDKKNSARPGIAGAERRRS